nr:hypothetical protein [Tanacetum cinerariifolium]
VAKEVVVEKTAEIKENAKVLRRQEESQAQIYQIDLERADKVLSMQDDELEPAELKEVVEVVTTVKLMTEVVTAAATATITTADTPILLLQLLLLLDKIAQTLEITKLKQRVKKLERRYKLKVSKLKRLKKVGTAQRVDTSEDTVMDDVSKQGEIIANMDVNEDVTL